MKHKWILRTIAVIVLILIVGFVAVAMSLGAIVKKGVERIGPSATHVDVTLKGAEVWLFDGRAQLTGFVVGNPPGCKTADAVTVGRVSVQLKPSSIFKNKVVVESINVKSPVITLEGGLKNNNLATIEKNINDYVGSPPSAPATNTQAAPSSPAQAERKVQVNDLVISGAKLQVNTALSGGKTVTLAIPDIHLTDLGPGPEGVTPVEVGQKALHAVLVEASKALMKDAGQLGKNALNGAAGDLKHLDVHKATASLKGLFQ